MSALMVYSVMHVPYLTIGVESSDLRLVRYYTYEDPHQFHRRDCELFGLFLLQHI